MQPEVLPLLGIPQATADIWAGPISAAMEGYKIISVAEQAAFMAQILHETGMLKFIRELWGPTTAQKGYEGRRDLGNDEPGDGYKYRGRGCIQITGRGNYAAVAAALGIDCENHPELLEQPEYAAQSAAWFWNVHGLSKFADAGDFDGVSDIINRGHKTAAIGDSNGWADRKAIWEKAKQALSI